MWAAQQIERAAENAIEHERQRFEDWLNTLLFVHAIPFSIWIAKAFFVIVALIAFSVATYSCIYCGVVMRGLEVQSRPIFFDYSAENPPNARVDLLSTNTAPWKYAGGVDSFNGENSPDKNICTSDDDEGNSHRVCNGRGDVETINFSIDDRSHIVNTRVQGKSGPMDEPRVLVPGQRYFFEIVLKLPGSEINRKLGVFMVEVNLISSDESILATSKQASMFPYESDIVGLTRKFFSLVPLTLGLLSEAKTISLLCFDNYMELDYSQPLSSVEVALGIANSASFPATSQSIQILSAELRIGKELSPIQTFVRKWFYFCGSFGIALLFVSYAFLALYFLNNRCLMKHRVPTPPNNQPYVNLFDSDNDDISAANAEGGSRRDRCMDADMEFLDGNDGAKWEPLNLKKKVECAEKRTGIHKQVPPNVVSDDESFHSSENELFLSKKSFPLGPLSNHVAVAGHKPMFSPVDDAKLKFKNNSSKSNGLSYRQPMGRASRVREERLLANMVMKGHSKWEIFTDHDDPDVATPPSQAPIFQTEC